MATKNIDLLKQKITDYLTDINTLRKNNEILGKKVKELEGDLAREKNTHKKLQDEKENLIKELDELKAAKSKPRTTRKSGSATKASGEAKTKTQNSKKA
jgi:hypothetical protein